MVMTGTISLGWGIAPPWTSARSSTVSSRRRGHSLTTRAFADNTSDATSSEADPEGGHQPFQSTATTLPAQGIAAWPLLFRTFALHTAHLAARVFYQPLQPAAERLQVRAAASEAVRRACDQLACDDLGSLRELCNALALSECVYFVVDRRETETVRIISALKSAFPPGLGTLTAAQFASPNVKHRFCVAESETEFYVAFMGTKLARDYVANAAVWEEQVRLDACLLSNDEADSVGDGGSSASNGSAAGTSSSSSSSQQQQQPAAHRGFVSRARGIHIDQLFEEAQRRGKKLVLCGHSLGGSVAQLCAVHILQRLPPSRYDEVSCVTFAAPALCNKALADLSVERGWDARIRNYLVPEDPIPHLLTAKRPAVTNGAAIAAAGAANGVNNSQSNSNNASSTNTNVQADDSAAPEGSVPPHLRLAGAVGNILLKRSFTSSARSSSSQSQSQSSSDREDSANKDSERVLIKSTADENSASLTTNGEQPSSASSSAAAAPAGERRRKGQLLGAVAGSPWRVAKGAVLYAVSVPMLAAPRYLPLGRQLYILQDGVQQGPEDGSVPTFPPPTSTTVHKMEVNTPTLQTSLDGSDENEQQLQLQLQQRLWWWSAMPWRRRFFSSSAIDANSAADGGDDDNVDVAAATALQSGGIVIPSELPRRTLFRAHRMLTYRSKLMTLANDALQGAHFRRWSPLALLDALPTGGDVTYTELLAPSMFPLKAQATILGSITSGTTEIGTHNGGGAINAFDTRRRKDALDVPIAAVARRWAWPFGRIIRRRSRNTQDDSAPIEVLVRVEGRGLSNVTSAWVSGASTPTTVEIVSQPQPPSPSAVLRSANATAPSLIAPLVAPVAAFASWVALTAGWMLILRQLQPAAQGDYLLAKVKLPAGAVRRAQAAASDPLLAAVGDAPKLMVHLASDFAVQSLPLEVQSLPRSAVRKGRSWMMGRGLFSRDGGDGDWKDAGDFLRHTRPKWMPSKVEDTN